MVKLRINGEEREVDVPERMPLLWALRDVIKLTGTKYGCGKGMCGVCTVQLDGVPVRSCLLPVGNAVGKNVTTIEGVAASAIGAKVQAAWLDEQVAQCGYCQSGQIVSATALLMQNAAPSDADIEAAMSGNLCRCGTYVRIRKAIKRAAGVAGDA